MKRESVKDLIESFGMIAIVASLIFVAMELRQSQEIAIASQYQARTSFNLDRFGNQNEYQLNQAAEGFLLRLDHDSLSAVQKEWLSGKTPYELGMEIAEARNRIFVFDNLHYQYQAGFYDEESWQASRSRFKRLMSRSFIAQHYLFNRPDSWRKSFIEEASALLEEANQAD